MAQIVVVGLGPAGPELLTEQTQSLLSSDAPVWLRTTRHDAARVAPNASSFDSIYDEADDITDVYPAIVEQLVVLAQQHQRIVYAVPGSPLVAEHTVELLRNDARVDVEIFPALSFLELIWARLGIDPLTAMPRIIDGQRFATDAAGQTGPLIVSQCDSRAVLSDIKLAFEDSPPETVTIMQRLGAADERIETIAWEDLDRIVDADHLTTLWIEHVAVPVAHDLEQLHVVARDLRERCPWDKEQTHESLKRYAIEETYELVDAIDEGNDNDEHVIEELGDVLYQVFAHCAIAEEAGRFNISDVSRELVEKLIQRHPHVYGDVVAVTAEDVKADWEANKMKLKGRTSVMDGIPRSLPALMRATKVLKKAAGTEVEVAIEDLDTKGLGTALLVMADEARQRKVDPEAALRAAVDEYVAKFQFQEK